MRNERIRGDTQRVAACIASSHGAQALREAWGTPATIPDGL